MRIEQAKNLLWGTYGKGALERYLLDGTTPPPMKVKPLGDCDTEHLEAILRHVTPLTHGYERYHVVSAAVHLVLFDRRCDRRPTPHGFWKLFHSVLRRFYPYKEKVSE